MHAFSIVRGQTECVEVCVAGLNSDPLLTECVGTKGLRKSERKQRRRMGKRESPAVIHFVPSEKVDSLQESPSNNTPPPRWTRSPTAHLRTKLCF